MLVNRSFRQALVPLRPALRNKSTPSQKAGDKKLPQMAAFKYFINKSTVLGVYREALQLCRKGFSDVQMQHEMADLVRYEFEPFRKYSGMTQQSDEVQIDIDYVLAKARQRINQIKEYQDRTN